MKRYLRMNDLANYASVSKTTIRKWINEGLRCKRINGIILFKTDEVDNFIDRYEKLSLYRQIAKKQTMDPVNQVEHADGQVDQVQSLVSGILKKLGG